MADSADARARLEATITGEVQGVGFRYFVLRYALRLGLRGSVRNLPDGGVEVVAEGPRRLLDDLLRELWRGPRGARVDDIRVTWKAAENGFDGFHIRP
jgi:acylphosphatase